MKKGKYCGKKMKKKKTKRNAFQLHAFAILLPRRDRIGKGSIFIYRRVRIGVHFDVDVSNFTSSTV